MKIKFEGGCKGELSSKTCPRNVVQSFQVRRRVNVRRCFLEKNLFLSRLAPFLAFRALIYLFIQQFSTINFNIYFLVSYYLLLFQLIFQCISHFPFCNYVNSKFTKNSKCVVYYIYIFDTFNLCELNFYILFKLQYKYQIIVN